eukprot:Sspe_Gene.36825::Locus_17799_Transcript_1_1_Confidence_1.000_Length_1537::g.36825::m.36825
MTPHRPKPPGQGKARVYVRRHSGDERLTSVSRKQRLREQQQAAASALGELQDRWRTLSSTEDWSEPAQWGTRRVHLSAHDCNPDFPHTIPPQYPGERPQPFDYKHVLSRVRQPVRPWEEHGQHEGGVVERGLARTVNEIVVASQEDVLSASATTRTSRNTPSSHPCRNPSTRASTGAPRFDRIQMLLADSEDEAGTPDPPTFHRYFAPGLFSYETRNPSWVRRNEEITQRVRKEQLAQLDKETRQQRAKYLLAREGLMGRFRKRMREQFEQALLRKEPHALRKLEGYLQQRHMEECRRTIGDRCAPVHGALPILSHDPLSSSMGSPTLASAVIDVLMTGSATLRAGNRVTVPRQNVNHSIVSLPETVERGATAPAPSLQQEAVLSSRHTPPHSAEYRPFSPLAPRPAKLISRNSERIASARLKRVPDTLSQSWDLTAEETYQELDRFSEYIKGL